MEAVCIGIFLFKYSCLVLEFLLVINDAEYIAKEVMRQSVYSRNFYLLWGKGGTNQCHLCSKLILFSTYLSWSVCLPFSEVGKGLLSLLKCWR